jgi:hypothetical protein
MVIRPNFPERIQLFASDCYYTTHPRDGLVASNSGIDASKQALDAVPELGRAAKRKHQQGYW